MLLRAIINENQGLEWRQEAERVDFIATLIVLRKQQKGSEVVQGTIKTKGCVKSGSRNDATSHVLPSERSC